MALMTLLLIWAVFAQAMLAMIVLLKMRSARVRAYKESSVSLEEIAVNSSAWPDYVRKIQNNYANQFELPVLFYLACTMTLIFGIENLLFVVISWVFVVSRYVHMIIHTGSNRIRNRFRVFLIGMICVVLQWLYIIITTTTVHLQAM